MDVDPMSAREALLAIKYAKLGQEDLGAEPDFDLIVACADAGLSRMDPMNFELTDLLADRLAEAHKVLREWDREGSADNTDLESRTAEALTLPPDLESMVERRIGPNHRRQS